MAKLMIRARLVSAGGIVLSGILLAVGALTWIAGQGSGRTSVQFAALVFLLLAVAVYLIDAWSESLVL
ncbi:MAG: hypothetical protein NUW08_01395, partial [Candidatus Uhrbacteria bacterium]|nr:hypothetical protein [Candidatus Uhrbacteria bacterium]